MLYRSSGNNLVQPNHCMQPTPQLSRVLHAPPAHRDRLALWRRQVDSESGTSLVQNSWRGQSREG